MAEVGLFFGSDEGNTESVAYKIQAAFGEDMIDVLDVANVTQLEFANFEKLIFGIPTWDFGQIQSDWDDFWADLEEIDFSGKTVALFGLGDQFGYGDFFLDAMGMLHDVIVANGATVIGHWPTEGYEFDASKAKLADQDVFVGLALDEDQQPELTGQRLYAWCQQVANEFELGIEVNPVD
ncbi:flavodoxin I [Alteromonadaceae bacterium Bs31]|nr:flavodoxin I [Alteromonadaceae bacterium Bs31]